MHLKYATLYIGMYAISAVDQSIEEIVRFDLFSFSEKRKAEIKKLCQHLKKKVIEHRQMIMSGLSSTFLSPTIKIKKGKLLNICRF